MLIYMGNGTYLRVTAGDVIALIVTIALVVCVVVAYFMAISCMVKAARAKSERFSSGKLWFIGLFTTPVILGLICCALKDEKTPAAPAQASQIPAAPQQTPVTSQEAPAARDVEPTAALPKAGSQQPAASAE